MESPVAVTVHPSVFPERTRAAYLESFRTRRMNHRFHYESEKQAQQWLALHEAYSPARTDENCLQTYVLAFSDFAEGIHEDRITLISLGCGGGQKDARLVKNLQGRCVQYIPTDVSLPLALTAHLQVAMTASSPAIFDLSTTPDFGTFLGPQVAPHRRVLYAFFGILPNFEPADALAPLTNALTASDFLLVSANLAPGADYHCGVEKVLPLYDNELTRRWLSTSLADAGL